MHKPKSVSGAPHEHVSVLHKSILCNPCLLDLAGEYSCSTMCVQGGYTKSKSHRNQLMCALSLCVVNMYM